jgi:hypothetical protein
VNRLDRERRRGRPILGAISGLLLGAFAAIDLHIMNIWTLSRMSESVLPLAGLLIGLGLGMTGAIPNRWRPVEVADTYHYPDDDEGLESRLAD